MGMALDELKQNGMMAHLIESLDRGESIGHYGRLVFAMVARYFMEKEEVAEYLMKDPDCDEAKSHALVEQVDSRDYNPPRRDRVLEWMKRQDFDICNAPSDPDACNVYKDLQFPRELYESIEQYREQKAEAEAER
jgi:hypothetical protein